ncbi:MAG TPA: dTDP-4-dehydrorhamnose 3,5-epimerase [Methanotrichaceae archaeon]|nr:dTDP-4-dehydrorhamnose 3,5-epimerase [Methanotrichaceae archaeon]
MPFEFKRLEIPEAILIKPKVYEDDRGFFLETYKKQDMENIGIKTEFVQDNHSRSERGVLRGLHFQKEPYSQAKIVRCVRGKIYDVAVDLRKNSPTFSRYLGLVLSEQNKHQLFVPRGCAHGFLVLSDVAEVVYKVDNVYAPEYEEGLIWSDPEVDVSWPLNDLIISKRDRFWPTLKDLAREDNLF